MHFQAFLFGYAGFDRNETPFIESASSKGVLTMKYRILGLIAGVLTIVAQFMPSGLRHFLLRKVKTAMYLIFG